MCSVLVWRIIEANRYENLVIFLEISVAIDPHEGSGPTNHEIITNFNICGAVLPQNILLGVFYG